MAIKFVDRTAAEGEAKAKKPVAPKGEPDAPVHVDPPDGALSEAQDPLLDLALPKSPASLAAARRLLADARCLAGHAEAAARGFVRYNAHRRDACAKNPRYAPFDRALEMAMPLVPVDAPAEYFGSEVRFAMHDPGDQPDQRLWVTVTLGALDGLAAADLDGPRVAAWVEDNRGKFEQIASAKHDAGQSLRITTNDWIARFPMPA